MTTKHARATATFSALIATLALGGCGSNVDVGGFGGAGGEGEGGATTTTGTGSSGVTVAIHMRSSAEPFAHQDVLAGQTASAHKSGVRSLTLLRDMNDPSPFEVFDFGQEAAEVDYAPGASTLVFEADAATFPEANFTIARVVHSYVKYSVDATMHNAGFVVPGRFDNMQVLSDGSLVDGELYDAGHYEYTFVAGGMSFPATGENAPIPEWQSSGGFSVVFENGEWAYYFPVSLPTSPALPADMNVILEVNMHESFRWSDQQAPNYEPGVFDVTPTSFEPVQKFGANAFSVYAE